ncbi:hypothetical protein BRM70_11950, partial [Xanthomonas oryzae pv. oryzae]
AGAAPAERRVVCMVTPLELRNLDGGLGYSDVPQMEARARAATYRLAGHRTTRAITCAEHMAGSRLP